MLVIILEGIHELLLERSLVPLVRNPGLPVFREVEFSLFAGDVEASLDQGGDEPVSYSGVICPELYIVALIIECEPVIDIVNGGFLICYGRNALCCDPAFGHLPDLAFTEHGTVLESHRDDRRGKDLGSVEPDRIRDVVYGRNLSPELSVRGRQRVAFGG